MKAPWRSWTLIPLALMLGLIFLFAASLGKDPRDLPSPLVERQAPTFSASMLGQPGQTVDSRRMLGQPWVLNVWASWCGSCQQEHAVVKMLADAKVPVYGLNYKDTAPKAQAWLARLGDPYLASAEDPSGRIGMDFGVYGLPETFVIDAQGKVRLRHAGPLTKEQLERELLPLIKALKG